MLLAWVLLLAGTLDGQVRDGRLLLCAVTALSALSCWIRVATLRAERRAWASMAVGLSGYAVGFAVLFYVSMGERGGPFGLNYSDCASLLLYPAGYTSLLLLARGRVRGWQTSAVLDGGIVALAASAAAVAWAAASYPTLLHGGVLDVIYALAYPVGGATLLVATVTGLAMTSWRVDPTWAWLILGFAVMTVGDAIYGMQSAAGTFSFGSPLDAAYTAGPVLVSLAAWRRPRSGPARSSRYAGAALTVPALATLVALAVLVVDHSHPEPAASVALAAGAVVLAVGRTGMFVRQERQLVESRKQAKTDDLTGLMNRRAFLALLQTSSAAAEPTALLLVNLDRFKEVNDILGSAAGDGLLVAVATRLSALPDVRVARLRGDEFALLADVTHTELDQHAAAIQFAFAPPELLEGCSVTVAASIGVVAGADLRVGASLPAELLRRADVALDRAKHLRSGLESWTPALDVGARDRLELVAELREALTVGSQVVVHYQPKMATRTGHVSGMEALVRWEHPRRGLLGPGAFLPAAERGGLMRQITRQVVNQVLAALVAHPDLPPVAVNLSASDLLDATFADDVARQLAALGLAPQRLRFEITEDVVMSDPDRILATLHRLRALGHGLSLDDYGTGLSSLSYLRSLPIDELKIDRSFVQQMTRDRASALIVSSTVTLSHELGLTVVAEGIEDAETQAAVAATGCDVLQGYLLGRPGPLPLPPRAGGSLVGASLSASTVPPTPAARESAGG